MKDSMKMVYITLKLQLRVYQRALKVKLTKKHIGVK